MDISQGIARPVVLTGTSLVVSYSVSYALNQAILRRKPEIFYGPDLAETKKERTKAFVKMFGVILCTGMVGALVAGAAVSTLDGMIWSSNNGIQ